MIIKLRKYNEIRDLLIENGTTGSQAQVSYWDVLQEVSVTREVSHINLAWNNVQLPTPHLSPYLNTDSLFVHGFPSFFQQSSSEQPSHIAFDHHV